MTSFPLIPGAVLLRYDGDDDAANRAAVDHAEQLLRVPGVLDAIPGARTTLVVHEPGAVLPPPQPGLRREMPRRVPIPMRYDDTLDAGLRSLHREAIYRVAFIGFAPGFPYLVGLPPELHRKRLATPRTRTPAGSVAIADRYCGIYPTELPGGWNVIGRTAVRLFDGESTLLAPGEEVKFEEGDAPQEPPPRPTDRMLGGPRWGRGRFGVPRGGAVDLGALEEGNRLVGNPPHAPAFELTLVGGDVTIDRDAWVCLSGAPIESPLERGKPLQVKAGARLRFGRVRQGLRSYLCVGQERVAGELAPFAARDVVLRVVPGPQAEWFDFAAFVKAEWKLSPQSDRRGCRLEGPALTNSGATEIPPEGNAPGAVQVPGSGQPIVLGPDGPVTGGYPKIATVLPADLALLAQARPGSPVRFTTLQSG